MPQILMFTVIYILLLVHIEIDEIEVIIVDISLSNFNNVESQDDSSRYSLL